jgi:hypothetical protein
VRRRGSLSPREVNDWYRTPGQNGKSLADMVNYNARKYWYLDREGEDYVRSRLNEALAKAVSKFDESHLQEGEDKRRAFERFLSYVFRNEIADLAQENKAESRGGQHEHVELDDTSVGAGQDSSEAETFDDIQRLAQDLPENMQAGIAAMLNGLAQDLDRMDLYKAVEKASGLTYTTFFGRLRQNPDFQEWAADV